MPSDIQFEYLGWSRVSDIPENSEGAWANSEGLVIVLQHFGPDKPLRERLSDVNAVRAHYRKGFAKEGIGLIECDVWGLEGIPAVRAIGKVMLQPTRAAYAGTVAVPLPQESYVFNLMAEEIGISGVRDTAIFVKTRIELERTGYSVAPTAKEQQSAGAKTPMAWRHAKTGAVVSWAQDPYDPGFNGPCLRNLADAAEHDAGFPQHPLSRVRVALDSLMKGVRLSEEVRRRADER